MDSDPKPAPLPARIRRLNELAHDLGWSWHPQAREVFRRLDYPIWRLTAHNPVRMLRTASRDRLEQVARDSSFLELYDRAIEDLDRARRASDTWWSQHFPGRADTLIAYFSAEFALHQSIPIYAGGLGVLAGDHCKEASDLGVPLIGVGFMYPQGYFHQSLSPDGSQVEQYETLEWEDVPVKRVQNADGRPCTIAVPLASRKVWVSLWRVQLGRVTLYLLDTNVEANAPWDRELSARLYGGSQEARIQQEIILGVGGVRALRSLGLDPTVWHLNEGHSAFVVLERMRELLERGESFQDALEQVRGSTIFTTHTPVAAGHDAFPYQLVEFNLAAWWDSLAAHRDAFLRLGDHNDVYGPRFNMTALAMRTAAHINAVSRTHHRVTAEMWATLWPETPESDRPVKTVSNGIHVPTWVAPAMAELFERHLGPDWKHRYEDVDFWDQVLLLPDEELWRARQALRSYLCTFVRERARQLWVREHAGFSRVVAAGALLDPAALTIGFARRFAAYKRPELIFHDSERLARILDAPRRPVQVVFAGKAHPADEAGKRHLQQVYQRVIDPRFGGRIAFVEDYDLHVAHFLVQGCDVWLNNPRKPLEASGTSGMKASINGVINLSVGDGWWADGYTGSNGWLIEAGSNGTEDIDAADAEVLYGLLEEEVVPTFYERDQHGVPQRWLQIVKEAIRTVGPEFSARRMVKRYALEMYMGLSRRAPNSPNRD